MEIDPDLECDRAITRGVQAPDQDSDPSALGGNSSDVVLGSTGFGADPMRKVDGWQTLNEKPSDPAIVLAA
jgi:hypothetical protein